MSARIPGSLNVIVLSPQHSRTVLKRSFYVRCVTDSGWSIKVGGKENGSPSFKIWRLIIFTTSLKVD